MEEILVISAVVRGGIVMGMSHHLSSVSANTNRKEVRGMDRNEKYVESITRTKKLYCSECGAKIPKGEQVVFVLDAIEDKMIDVYCFGCKGKYAREVILHDTSQNDID